MEASRDRVAISNSRLVALDEAGVTFKWKDYRIKGRDRMKTMTLDAGEFIRRFLLHVRPSGFHRIRHYGLLAGAVRADNIERARQLLAPSKTSAESAPADADGDDGRERGVVLGRRGIGEQARTSRSCSGARLEAEAIDGARRDGRRGS